jgi:hypothetical protein
VPWGVSKRARSTVVARMKRRRSAELDACSLAALTSWSHDMITIAVGRAAVAVRVRPPGEVSQRQLGDPAAGSIETDNLPEADWGKLRNYLIVAPHP